MDRRFFIGPYGARFSRPDPLPRWLAQMLERGEVIETTDGAASAAPSSSKKSAPADKPRPARPKNAQTSHPAHEKPSATQKAAKKKETPTDG